MTPVFIFKVKDTTQFLDADGNKVNSPDFLRLYRFVREIKVGPEVVCKYQRVPDSTGLYPLDAQSGE